METGALFEAELRDRALQCRQCNCATAVNHNVKESFERTQPFEQIGYRDDIVTPDNLIAEHSRAVSTFYDFIRADRYSFKVATLTCTAVWPPPVDQVSSRQTGHSLLVATFNGSGDAVAHSLPCEDRHERETL